MNINIKYFGVLAEKTACQEEQIDFESGKVSDVMKLIIKRHPNLKSEEFQVAQNKSIVNREVSVDGTEIALLPPFSGG